MATSSLVCSLKRHQSHKCWRPATTQTSVQENTVSSDVVTKQAQLLCSARWMFECCVWTSGGTIHTCICEAEMGVEISRQGLWDFDFLTVMSPSQLRIWPQPPRIVVVWHTSCKFEPPRYRWQHCSFNKHRDSRHRGQSHLRYPTDRLWYHYIGSHTYGFVPVSVHWALNCRPKIKSWPSIYAVGPLT